MPVDRRTQPPAGGRRRAGTQPVSRTLLHVSGVGPPGHAPAAPPDRTGEAEIHAGRMPALRYDGLALPVRHSAISLRLRDSTRFRSALHQPSYGPVAHMPLPHHLTSALA